MTCVVCGLDRGSLVVLVWKVARTGADGQTAWSVQREPYCAPHLSRACFSVYETRATSLGY